MDIHVHATYKAGVIYRERPLALPENTEVELTVIPSGGARNIPARSRPAAPQLSPAELRERFERYAVSAGTLPADFSRADIYQDHD